MGLSHIPQLKQLEVDLEWEAAGSRRLLMLQPGQKNLVRMEDFSFTFSGPGGMVVVFWAVTIAVAMECLTFS